MLRQHGARDGSQVNRAVRRALSALLMAAGLVAAGCAETGEPISRTPNDKCLVRACSVFY